MRFLAQILQLSLVLLGATLPLSSAADGCTNGDGSVTESGQRVVIDSEDPDSEQCLW
jgi:hypothetical protein